MEKDDLPVFQFLLQQVINQQGEDRQVLLKTFFLRRVLRRNRNRTAFWDPSSWNCVRILSAGSVFSFYLSIGLLVYQYYLYDQKAESNTLR